MPERVAEQDLQTAHARLLEDRRDIQAIKKWHDSMIKQRMVEWQDQYLQPQFGSPRVCPFEGEVLFCDKKIEEERDFLRIVDTKYSLLEDWFEEEHGLDVIFRRNQSGTLRYLKFGFYSAAVEERILHQSLKGRRDFDGHVRISLYTIRIQAQLPMNVIKIIKQFMPDYLEHLQQEKERVETKALRW